MKIPPIQVHVHLSIAPESRPVEPPIEPPAPVVPPVVKTPVHVGEIVMSAEALADLARLRGKLRGL